MKRHLTDAQKLDLVEDKMVEAGFDFVNAYNDFQRIQREKGAFSQEASDALEVANAAMKRFDRLRSAHKKQLELGL